MIIHKKCNSTVLQKYEQGLSFSLHLFEQEISLTEFKGNKKWLLV
jgi:hypothetical protein